MTKYISISICLGITKRYNNKNSFITNSFFCRNNLCSDVFKWNNSVNTSCKIFALAFPCTDVLDDTVAIYILQKCAHN